MENPIFKQLSRIIVVGWSPGFISYLYGALAIQTMTKLHKTALLACVVLIHCFTSVYSQTPDYRFRHLTTKQGLPSNIVNTIIKGRDGFMWMGTGNGLARYDGYQVKTFPLPEDTASGSGSEAIYSLLEDRQGNLWIGTAHQGLQLFDRVQEQFHVSVHGQGYPDSLKEYTVNAICQDRDGNLWIGTNGGGLVIWDPASGHYSPLTQELGYHGHPLNQIFALHEDETGLLWVGTACGVFRFDRSNRQFSPFDLGADIPPDYSQVNCFYEDHEGNLWIGTSWGMFRYDRYSGEIIHHLPFFLVKSPLPIPDPSNSLSIIYVRSIAEAQDSGDPVLWIATQWGLNRFDTGSGRFDVYFEEKRNPQSISSHFLVTLCRDDAGLLWIGTASSGADILDVGMNPFHRVLIPLNEGELFGQAACFKLASDGTLWVGGMDMGLFHFDRDFHLIGNYFRWKFGIDSFDEKQHNQIICIGEGDGRILWLGFNAWGLVAFDRINKTFNHVELPVPPGCPQPTFIRNIEKDNLGRLWIGTNAGLFFKNREDPVLDPAHPVQNGMLRDAEIVRIIRDKKDNLWISTRYQGLFCLSFPFRDSLAIKCYLDEPSQLRDFSGSYVNAMFEDVNGVLWLGSEKGLNILDPEKGQVEPDSLFNAVYGGKIIRIFGDRKGNLWIFHEVLGLIRYNPAKSAGQKVKVFDSRDGLPFDGFNTTLHYENTFYQDDEGRLFLSSAIGSDDGFLWFHPDSVKDNVQTPGIMITGIRVMDQRLEPDSSITVKRHIRLNYNENFFSFEFAALAYRIPEKNQYAYYLDGLEDGWNYTGNQRFANYTGVPPGTYTFRVKGSNNDGYWNETGASLTITVLPPPWKTGWAYTLYGLLLVGGIIAWRQYDLKRQRLKHALEIEHIEAQKLKELDSMKSRFFANISHEFRTPLTLILGPLQKMFSKATDTETRQDLAIMERNATRLHNLINELLDLSKLESGKMELQLEERDVIPLIKRYVQSFESLAKVKGIRLEFSAQKDNIPALVDPDKLEKILFNLLGNAFKWTEEGGRIEVTVSSQRSAVSGRTKIADRRLPTADLPEQCIVITISDTGTGIPPEKLPHIFDRFYQAGDSYTKDGEGTGIGLALTKELVELHGGTITAESVVNQGSTFRVFLPIGVDLLKSKSKEQKSKIKNDFDIENRQPTIDNQEPATCNLQPATDSIPKEAPLLLIVEDNPDMRVYIRGILEKEYRIREAGSGKQGLEQALEHVPDLVLTDVMMPEMDGFELSRKLKTDERTSHIPVILLTARAGTESRIEGLETGADDFITKPFDAQELLVRIRNMIDQRKKLRERYRRDFKLYEPVGSTEILSLDEKFLRKAKTVVENKLSDPEFGVEEFASEMALSRSQLSRKLSALMGQTVTEFIRTIRLNYALGLLKKRTGTISEIAYDSGFNNLTYFSISFKKQFGLSPTEYLNQKEKKEDEMK